MGSWSVYCGMSNIAITSGHQCVFLPLKKNPRESDNYLPYVPATLPIFGEYDDYGGIENIEENENTKLIAEHFGVSIQQFCHFFTRGCIRDDEDDFPKELKEVDEIKEWDFMFIDRKVYDFLSTYSNKGYDSGTLEFGNPVILDLLGMIYLGVNEKNKTYDPKRFKHEWTLQGKKFYSDGRWLQHDKESIFTLDGEYSALTSIVDIPEDKKWLGEKTMPMLWEYLEPKKQREELVGILGKDPRDSNIDFIETMIEIYKDNPELKKVYEELAMGPKPQTLVDKYCKDIPIFGKWMCQLTVMRHNLYASSGQFLPFTNYLTPQCGDFHTHQGILDKFAEINKSYCKELDDF
jgi:hypothetical protein